jgi:uncharacterized protein YjbI with pentapeptide repeats
VTVEAPLAPRPPELPDELEPLDLADGALHGLVLERALIEAADLADRAAPDLDVRESALRRVLLDGTEAAGLRLTDVRVDGGSWANLRAVRGSLARVELRDLRATGAELAEADVADVVFERVRLDLASFRFARLARVVFRDCRLEEADFHGATLSSVLFDGCALTGASVTAASFSRCEIAGCELIGLTGADSLGGVRMRWPDVLAIADQLARAAGIELVD